MSARYCGAAIVALIGLSACSGSGTGGSLVGGGSNAYSALLSEAARLSTRLGSEPPTTTLPSGPGASGATYQGVVVLADTFGSASSPASSTGVVGTANLTANFTSSTITGTGSGFFQTALDPTGSVTSGSGTPASGSLNFSSSSVGLPLFALGVDGTVDLDGASRTISGTALAGFSGTNADVFFAAGTDLATTTAYDVDIAIIAD